MKPKNLDEQINDTYEEVLRKEKIDIHIQGLELLIKNRKRQLRELEITLSKHAEDIEKLEKTNILTLFRKILGNPEQDIDREKQEYLIAVMTVEDCRSSLASLQHEFEVLKSVQSGLFGIEKKLKILLKQKDIRISQDNPELGKQIMLIDQRILNHKEKLKEINEAIQAGEITQKSLSDIINDLEHVVGWGPMEYTGKGTYSSYKKKRFIDKASHEIIKVNSLFLKFEEELYDIANHYQLDYKTDIHYYQDFLDIFINNLITDYVVRKKIKNSLAGVEATRDRVKMTIITLQHEIKKTKQYLLDDRELKRALLLNSVKKQ